ncbi:MAG: tRNA (adenosine(37)-N6)-threonylcarbamoyltransferase complex ATPase subunit type 1 TsaE [Candidatus Nanopelagicales bacterium]|nr:tRNA (adenosine(37)-N6)-threonylcarbamoyltransferase complex ATPase subunit type 1 TsaE [Candidatus Nanopelagicales bacterium]
MSAGGSFELAVGSAGEMVELGRALSRSLGAGDVVCLDGPLGAGKTTLTRGIGEGLGIERGIASPTFVLARLHPGPSVDLLHCDAYRVSDPVAFDDLDLDIADVITVIEWGGPVIEAVADSWLGVGIDRPEGESGDERRVTVSGHGERWTPAALHELSSALGAAGVERP